MDELLIITGAIGFIEFLATMCHIETYDNCYTLDQNPLNDTLAQLLGRLLVIPMYLFLLVIGIVVLILAICTSPIWGPFVLYQKVKSIQNLFNSIGNFFQKKPLEFLKNYKIEFERK